MHRQLRSNLPRLRSIAGLLAGPDLLMQAHPLPGRHARVHHFMIQGMAELIARRDRPIGPGLGTSGPDEPPLAGQGRQACFECLGRLCESCRHGGHGKRASRHTGGFQERLVRLRQLLEVLLDILPQAHGHQLAENRQGPLTPSGFPPSLQEPLASQLVHHGDEEQRIAASTLMQELRQTWRDGLRPAALPQIRRDRGGG
jgi:hypothetical protein